MALAGTHRSEASKLCGIIRGWLPQLNEWFTETTNRFAEIDAIRCHGKCAEAVQDAKHLALLCPDDIKLGALCDGIEGITDGVHRWATHAVDFTRCATEHPTPCADALDNAARLKERLEIVAPLTFDANARKHAGQVYQMFMDWGSAFFTWGLILEAWDANGIQHCMKPDASGEARRMIGGGITRPPWPPPGSKLLESARIRVLDALASHIADIPAAIVARFDSASDDATTADTESAARRVFSGGITRVDVTLKVDRLGEISASIEGTKA